MFNTYTNPVAAVQALREKGFDKLDFELRPVLGGQIQPIVVCESLHDAEVIRDSGFNARLAIEYAAD